MDEICRKWSIHGCSAVIVQQDLAGRWSEQILTYGQRNAEGDQVDADTRFFIASNSKLFCVLATGIALEEAGYPKGFKTRIKDVVAAYRLQDLFLTETVTFEDAFAHLTGLPRHDIYTTNDASTLEDQLRLLGGMKASLGIREATQYHNPHYDLIALIVEKITGQDYPSYVRKKILEPLGMASTSVLVSSMLESSNFAKGHWHHYETLESPGQSIELPMGLRDGKSACLGAGRMSSTAQDMGVWLKTLLGDGQHPQSGAPVIPSGMIKRCRRGTVRFDEYILEHPGFGPALYGLGLWEQPYYGHTLVQHVGALSGWMSRLVLIPESKLGIFVVTNNAPWGGLACDEITMEIVDRHIGLPKSDWTSRLLADKENVLRTWTSQLRATLKAASEETTSDGVPMDRSMITGTYTAPGFHKFTIKAEHILSHPPKSLWDLPWFPQIWCKEFQPLLWPGTSPHKYKMCFKCSFPEQMEHEDMLGLPCDVELLVEGGKVLGMGLRGCWGAGKGVPCPEGLNVRDRAEVFLDKIG
ncbi:hypothetical protein AYL99_02569 [Fonsecaea erecta]|uniref:Beta-lactamase-related domain-containing protein n=1 Tax=Fonsecaea erecta TaxID=1367422 RepID=A0A178ZUC9_9EURO|nr:hypothetical protein AYL99_02569 [Fonsecaea erecta]OAP63342.1 hypothetical protein AYL99_02569 [Fonsecaea erecta]